MPRIPTFRNLEKEKYLELKSELFSKEAQPKGTYRHHQYDFCLADGHSDENLHSSFRLDMLEIEHWENTLNPTAHLLQAFKEDCVPFMALETLSCVCKKEVLG